MQPDGDCHELARYRRLMLNAVQGKDYYLVMGNLLIGSVMLIFGNLVADILLAVSDPRIRYE